jgi:hypothetical protein
MIVGIDFDRVLFDTEAFKEELEAHHPGFLEHYDNNRYLYQTKPGDDDIPVPVSELEATMSELQPYLIENVEALSKSDLTFVIVSRGPQWFQRKKISNSNITTYIPRYITVDTEPKDMTNIDYLIDDNQDELQRISIPSFHFKRQEHTVDTILSLFEDNELKA